MEIKIELFEPKPLTKEDIEEIEELEKAYEEYEKNGGDLSELQ